MQAGQEPEQEPSTADGDDDDDVGNRKCSFKLSLLPGDMFGVSLAAKSLSKSIFEMAVSFSISLPAETSSTAIAMSSAQIGINGSSRRVGSPDRIRLFESVPPNTDIGIAMLDSSDHFGRNFVSAKLKQRSASESPGLLPRLVCTMPHRCAPRTTSAGRVSEKALFPNA